MESPCVLLVNPPIYDFAAFDLWAKPLGLLYISAILKDLGAEVRLLDCLDRSGLSGLASKTTIYGCGRYNTVEITKPEPIKDIPRKYHRYGATKEAILDYLANIQPPDIILVSSGMTYWYPGVIEIISMLKGIFPKVPFILGGVYATLCADHAESCSGADKVFPGSDMKGLFSYLNTLGFEFDVSKVPADFSEYPGPDYSGYSSPPYAAIRTSMGCPFRCSYCAIDQLSPAGWIRKSPQKISSEIIKLYKDGIKNIAFYDDGLLYKAEEHINIILSQLIASNINISIHSPNGMHARYMTRELARLMKNSGFVMPRISLESSSSKRQNETGGKVTNEQFVSAVELLKDAGYKTGEYAAYLLMGMPGQDLKEVEETIRFASGLGAKISLSEYSLIPGTKDWRSAKDRPAAKEPLLQNNSVFPLSDKDDWPKLQRLKDLARDLNKALKQ